MRDNTEKSISPRAFAGKLLRWYDKNGRQDLPWRQKREPYRVWLSEIMLQQTQVNTVIPYFQRFLRQFPNITALANAPLDEILHLWSGLGYYARARNLHATAVRIKTEFKGRFPDTLASLQTLPGIGRSTAGAILAISMHQRAPILDGNVKRVLARMYGIDKPITESATQKQLWELAERLTPKNRVSDYTQAIMDIGALICTRHRPQCASCPLRTHCSAFQTQTQDCIPVPKKSRPTPTRQTHFLMIHHPKHGILLTQRAAEGVWRDLWSFPELPTQQDVEQWNKAHADQWPIRSIQRLATFQHIFTHFKLTITPWVITVGKIKQYGIDSKNTVWYNTESHLKIGLAAPVKRLLESIYSKGNL